MIDADAQFGTPYVRAGDCGGNPYVDTGTAGATGTGTSTLICG